MTAPYSPMGGGAHPSSGPPRRPLCRFCVRLHIEQRRGIGAGSPESTICFGLVFASSSHLPQKKTSSKEEEAQHEVSGHYRRLRYLCRDATRGAWPANRAKDPS